MAESRIDQAIELAKQGNKTEARKIMTSVIRQERDNPGAWVVLAQVVETRAQAIDCLNQVLRLEPDHPWAKLHLARLTGTQVSEPAEEALPDQAEEMDDLSPDPLEEPNPVVMMDDPEASGELATLPELPRVELSPNPALEETMPAGLPRAQREPEIIAADDSLPEIDLGNDIDSIGEIEDAFGSLDASLDPLAGTGEWRVPTEDDWGGGDMGIPSLDNLRAEAGSPAEAMSAGPTGNGQQPTRRGRGRWLLLIVVFILFVAVGAALAWAALNGLLESFIPPGLLP